MRTPRTPFRDRGPTALWMHTLRWGFATLLSATGVACTTARADLEAFPPVLCSVEDAEGTERHASVEVDGAPATVRAGDLAFEVGYRTQDDGRILETTIRRSSGEVIEQVTYLIPGRTSLRNQFGPEREELTGRHVVDPQAPGRLLWSCTVGSDLPQEVRS